MKVLVLGEAETLGFAIIKELKESKHNYEIIIGGRKSGDIQVDITSLESIKAMFEKLGKVDHIIMAAGSQRWNLLKN
ncbi:hypothetical protein [Mesoplasma melaleucae]|uniref:hypothetical protein n=1 Tax=Mesoplasma melaleucae TaxID=81459 RepID=UPI000A3E18F4|nr:hypothetical protein [Mesoplasma melaleucae]